MDALPIRLILLSRITMLHSMLLGLAHGAVSVLGFPLSGTNPSHPSPSSPLTHHLYPPSKLRLLTHGWPSTLPLPVYNPTPTEPAYPPTTPSPPSSMLSALPRNTLWRRASIYSSDDSSACVNVLQQFGISKKKSPRRPLIDHRCGTLPSPADAAATELMLLRRS